MKIQLLIVEDEQAIRDMVRFALPDKEFELHDAENTKQANKILARQLPDLMLVDWMLPGKSGVEFIKSVKARDDVKNIPIILLTAKAEEENKVKGLMAGADDYITKPFSPAELIARIKTVLRRGPLVSPENEIQIRNLILNIEKHQAKIEDEVLNLSPIEYKLLHFFMTHPNRTYTRDQIITQVWGATVYIDDRSVDVQIRRLRDKLRAKNHQDIISTVRGVGYQLTK